MKVILQHSVQKLGKAGDIVEASPGYFRNFLQPRKLACLATDGTLRKREEDLDILRKKAEKAHAEYIDLAQRITDLGTIRFFAKIGEGGKLYGKVTTREVSALLEKHLGTAIDKRIIKADDMAALGTYKATIKLAADVQTAFTIEVHPEGTEELVEQKIAQAKAGSEPKASTANAEERSDESDLSEEEEES